jgi:protein-disulfide isomerase
MRKSAGIAMLTAFMAMLLLVLSTAAGCTTSPSTPGLTPRTTGQPLATPKTALKVIIYLDFQCGACEKLNSEVEPELRRLYESTGKINIEVRPLGAPGDDSMSTAEAALCAGDQGEFSEYEDALFKAGQEMDPYAFTTDQLVALAKSLGLDEVKFRNCLVSGEKEAEVEQNVKMAQRDEVSTLPALLVGETKIEGYKPLDTYVQAIEKALAAQQP